MSSAAPLLIALPVLVGALTQRATGLGFGLVGGPLLVAVAGPVVGVSMANALSVLLCLVVLARTWRHTAWREVALLAAPALASVPLGALVVRSLPEGPLLMLVGGMALVAISLVGIAGRRAAVIGGTAGAVAAGGLSGFMSVTAGVGGPPISAYSIARGWSRETLVPTAQAYLLITNVASLASKGVPDVSAAQWLVSIGALAVGVASGEWLDRRIDARTGRRLIMAVAACGGVAALVRGALM